MKVAIIENNNKYQIGFYSDRSKMFYDIYVNRRAIPVSEAFNLKTDNVYLFQCNVREVRLKEKIENNEESFLQWLKFKIYNLKNRVNGKMVNDELRHINQKTPWEVNTLVSAHDILEWYHGGTIQKTKKKR